MAIIWYVTEPDGYCIRKWGVTVLLANENLDVDSIAKNPPSDVRWYDIGCPASGREALNDPDFNGVIASRITYEREGLYGDHSELCRETLEVIVVEKEGRFDRHPKWEALLRCWIEDLPNPDAISEQSIPVPAPLGSAQMSEPRQQQGHPVPDEQLNQARKRIERHGPGTTPPKSTIPMKSELLNDVPLLDVLMFPEHTFTGIVWLLGNSKQRSISHFAIRLYSAPAGSDISIELSNMAPLDFASAEWFPVPKELAPLRWTEAPWCLSLWELVEEEMDRMLPTRMAGHTIPSYTISALLLRTDGGIGWWESGQEFLDVSQESDTPIDDPDEIAQHELNLWEEEGVAIQKLHLPERHSAWINTIADALEDGIEEACWDEQNRSAASIAVAALHFLPSVIGNVDEPFVNISVTGNGRAWDLTLDENGLTATQGVWRQGVGGRGNLVPKIIFEADENSSKGARIEDLSSWASSLAMALLDDSYDVTVITTEDVWTGAEHLRLYGWDDSIS